MAYNHRENISKQILVTVLLEYIDESKRAN